jgi:hypothetical protein
MKHRAKSRPALRFGSGVRWCARFKRPTIRVYRRIVRETRVGAAGNSPSIRFRKRGRKIADA